MPRKSSHSGRGARDAKPHAIAAADAEPTLEKQKEAILDLFRQGQAAQWSIGEHSVKRDSSPDVRASSSQVNWSKADIWTSMDVDISSVVPLP